MFKASLSGDGGVVDLSEVLEGLKLIRGIGIARAFQLAATGGDMLEALVQRGADDTYQANF